MGNTHWRKSPTTQWRKKCNTYNVIALAVVVVDSRMSILGLLEEGFHRQRFSVVTGCSLGGRLPLLQCSARARWKEKPRVWREFQPSLSSLLSRPVNWITVRFGIVYFSCEERHGVWPGMIYMSGMIYMLNCKINGTVHIFFSCHLTAQ